MTDPTLRQGRRVLGQARRSAVHVLHRASSSQRPLPDFLIIGAQKGGTTSLHAHLAEHSMVSAPIKKEVHFFDHNHGRGPSWYRAHFQRPTRSSQLCFESTPYYLLHPLVPKRVFDIVPEVRLLVVLRNPIDRAFSHHNHERALGFEDLGFEKALEREAERLDGEEDWILSDPDYRSFSHQHHSYLARGRYAEQLERWLKHFDREQLLVLSAEELFADPVAVVHRSQEFLGLPIETPRDLSARNARAYAPISAAARAHLGAEFEPDNRRLHGLLGQDFGWE